MTKLDEFDSAVQGLVNKERMEAYGHPVDHFHASMKIKKVLHDTFTQHGDPELLHALEMIADKMVRLCKTPTHLDSWIDIAGYARTGVMVIDRFEADMQKERRHAKPEIPTVGTFDQHCPHCGRTQCVCWKAT